MMLGDVGRDACLCRAQQHAAVGQPGNILEDIGGFDGLSHGAAPGKGRVPGHQDAGNGQRVELPRAEAAHNDRAGVADVASATSAAVSGSVTGTGPWK